MTLRRVRMYPGIQKRVGRRLRLSKGAVSQAATGRLRSKRQGDVQLALLRELAKHEPEVKALVAAMRRAAAMRHSPLHGGLGE